MSTLATMHVPVITVGAEVRDAVQGFLHDRRADIESVRYAEAVGDYQYIAYVVHMIKSEAEALGFPEIRYIGRELEAATLEHDSARIGRTVEKLESYLDRVQVRYVEPRVVSNNLGPKQEVGPNLQHDQGKPMRSRAQPRDRDTRGTSLVEVVVAMMVLTGTLLGMASVATLTNRQMVTAEFMMERDAVRRMTIEFLRALPYDSVRDGSDVLGGYQMAWTVTPEGPRSKALVIVTTGPGLEVRPPSVSSGIFPDVTDTVSHRVLRP